MPREITIQASRIFEENYNATERFVVNIGGTRSTKTYSILQVLITLALQSEEPLIISIVRKSFPSLKITAMRDFFDILKQMELYNENNHSKQVRICSKIIWGSCSRPACIFPFGLCW